MRSAGRCFALAAVALAVAVASCGTDRAGTDPFTGLAPAARLGLEEAQHAGCAGCHGVDFRGGVAPALVGLAGSTVALADGTTVVADRAYLAESIAEPGAKVVAGATLRMPENSLTDVQIAQIVDWLVAVGVDPEP